MAETTRDDSSSRRLSLFVSAHRRTLQADALYDRTLRLLEAAERHGYRTAWTVARHFATGEAGLPSILPLFAAASQRTRALRLGTGVVPLIFEDPLRLAEDAAITDQLSHGRIELGIGRGLGNGLSEPAHRAFDVPEQERDALFDQKLESLEHALSGAPVPGADRPIWPVSPGLAGRVWQAASTHDVVADIARRGHGLLLNRNAKHFPASRWQAGLIDTYHENLRSIEGAQARIGAVRVLFFADTEHAALALLRAHSGDELASSTDQEVRDFASARNIAVGSFDQVVETLGEDEAVRRSTEVIAALPDHTDERDSLADLEAAATRIAPYLEPVTALSAL